MTNQIKQESNAKLEDFIPELKFWDDDDVAFIKNNISNGKETWQVYSSDGIQIAATNDRTAAFIIARHNEFTPYSVH